MNILFPVVRSTKVSRVLVPFVKNMANLLSAGIYLLRVEPPIDEYIEKRVKEAEIWLDEFKGDNFADADICRTEVIPGNPADEILAYIDKNDIDCVMIGTHGRKGFDRIFFGGVALEIVRRAAVPVMSINPYRLDEKRLTNWKLKLEKLINTKK